MKEIICQINLFTSDYMIYVNDPETQDVKTHHIPACSLKQLSEQLYNMYENENCNIIKLYCQSNKEFPLYIEDEIREVAKTKYNNDKDINIRII